jgi:hypothetical protein
LSSAGETQAPRPQGSGLIEGTVVHAEYTGAASLVHVELDTGKTCLLRCQGNAPGGGQRVSLGCEEEKFRWFGQDGRSR